MGRPEITSKSADRAATNSNAGGSIQGLSESRGEEACAALRVRVKVGYNKVKSRRVSDASAHQFSIRIIGFKWVHSWLQLKVQVLQLDKQQHHYRLTDRNKLKHTHTSPLSKCAVHQSKLKWGIL